MSYIFMVRYWSLGCLLKTATEIADVISWSCQCMSCFTTYCHACCNIQNVNCEHSLTIYSPHDGSYETLSFKISLDLSFAWLTKNRLTGRQNCVGDSMEKSISNLQLSSITIRWADSARAAIDLSFHWWGETVLLKCQG